MLAYVGSMVKPCYVGSMVKPSVYLLAQFFTDLPGWPLLTPLKVQLQKCEKCSREFCSPINYRRHIRVHRRSLNVDKVFLYS